MKPKKISVKFIVLVCVLISTSALTQTLSPGKFKNRLACCNGILVDVRTVEEFKMESIGESLNINVNDSSFIEQIGKLDKKEGFKHVYDLEGGLTEWKKKGYKVTSAKLN